MTNHKELERQVFDQMYQSNQSGDMTEQKNDFEITIDKIQV